MNYTKADQPAASVTIIRRIKAAPSKVFAAITRPELMIQWWGPDAGPTIHAETDLRVGGRFAVAFQMLNGQINRPTGIYQEVINDHKLVFTWEWPGKPEALSVVSIVLKAIPEGTELTLEYKRLPNEEAIESHRTGWIGLLEKLAMFTGDE